MSDENFAELLTPSELATLSGILAAAARRRAVELAESSPSILNLGVRARFTVEETGTMLGISAQAVRNRIAAGEVRAIREGRTFSITRAEIERLAGYRPGDPPVRSAS